MWTPWRKQYAIIRLELNDGSSLHFLSEQNGFRRAYYSFASKKLKRVGLNYHGDFYSLYLLSDVYSAGLAYVSVRNITSVFKALYCVDGLRSFEATVKDFDRNAFVFLFPKSKKVEEEPEKECQTLSTAVFDLPECPNWAKYAAVDDDGRAFWYSDEPSVNAYWGTLFGGVKRIPGVFDSSDWENSLLVKLKKRLNKEVYYSKSK